MHGAPARHPNVLLWMASGLIVLALAQDRMPLLVWNASASAPVGLYLATPATSVARGDLVLVTPPDDVAALAAARGYLPRGVPLVKRIAGLHGDVVCSPGRRILINGGVVAKRLDRDREGRSLPFWHGCFTLGLNQILLLMKGVRNSFDGRYFGPVPRSAVLGKLVPLWIR